MDALMKALQTNAKPCADDECSTSEDCPTMSADINADTGDSYSDDDEELTTTTDYKTISADDFTDDQPTSLSDYRTLSPDLESERVDNRNNDYPCKICCKRFKTLKECLRHDLLEHNNKRELPPKAVRMRLKTMLPVLEQGDHQAERERIHELLKNCPRDMALHKLFQVYCISVEKARHIGALVSAALETSLRSIRYLSIHGFGSVMNGLMTCDSDVDIYITAGYQNNHRYVANRQLTNKDRPLFNRVNSILRQSNMFDEIVTIRNARVPIIKCRHRATGMKVDINCSCPNSVVNSQFLNDLLQCDVRLGAAMRFLKIWAKRMKLIGRGNMTSYCLTTLVLFSLQQPLKDHTPVVPSIKLLQTRVQPKFVEGINYAYDLHRYMQPLPVALTTQDFLRGFFSFYRNFDFKNNMVTPFLGETISLSDFKTGKFKYLEYERQLRKMKELAKNHYDVEDLSIDRCMVVQDPFQLNQNIARGVAGAHLDYFRKCVEYAYHICMEPNIEDSAESYERLLFDVIKHIEADAHKLRESASQRMLLDSTSSNELIFSFTPSRGELRALQQCQLNANNANTLRDGVNNNVYREWMQHYMEAIYAILTLVYRMKVCLVPSNDADGTAAALNEIDAGETLAQTKLKKLFWQVLEKKGELVWQISSSIDLWNGRTYNRQNSSTFMAHQIKQTEQLLNTRTKKPEHAVQVNGLLTVKRGDGYKSLAITVTQSNKARTYLTKKDPLRKFFTSFKSSMQNFNLKEKLQAESGRKDIL